MKKKILIISVVFPPEQVTSAFLNYDLAHELEKEYDVTERDFRIRLSGGNGKKIYCVQEY